MARYDIHLNGQRRRAEAEPDSPLLYVLRDQLEMSGPKFGCGVGQCGACTVHVDGQAVRSCSYPVAALGSKKVTTLEKAWAASQSLWRCSRPSSTSRRRSAATASTAW